jgi:hypothetical protein
MDRTDMADLWDRIKDRPQAVREHRDDLADHVSESVAAALPGPGDSAFAYRQFLNDYKGTVTRQLTEGDEGVAADA